MNITYTHQKVGCGYHYCVTKGSYPYTAFRTKEAFLGWLALHEISIKSIRQTVKGDIDKYIDHEFFTADKEIEERLFNQADQLPEDAKPFIGLSNGNYVTCYIIVGQKNFVYRPNPNAKNVYKPFDYRQAEKLVNSGIYGIEGLTS